MPQSRSRGGQRMRRFSPRPTLAARGMRCCGRCWGSRLQRSMGTHCAHSALATWGPDARQWVCPVTSVTHVFLSSSSRRSQDRGQAEQVDLLCWTGQRRRPPEVRQLGTAARAPSVCAPALLSSRPPACWSTQHVPKSQCRDSRPSSLHLGAASGGHLVSLGPGSSLTSGVVARPSSPRY